jgi:hypothetical protein
VQRAHSTPAGPLDLALCCARRLPAPRTAASGPHPLNSTHNMGMRTRCESQIRAAGRAERPGSPCVPVVLRSGVFRSARPPPTAAPGPRALDSTHNMDLRARCEWRIAHAVRAACAPLRSVDVVRVRSSTTAAALHVHACLHTTARSAFLCTKSHPQIALRARTVAGVQVDRHHRPTRHHALAPPTPLSTVRTTTPPPPLTTHDSRTCIRE